MNSYIASEIVNRANAREVRHRTRIRAVSTLVRLENFEAEELRLLANRVRLNAEEIAKRNKNISAVVTFDNRTGKWNLRAGYGLKDSGRTPRCIKNAIMRN